MKDLQLFATPYGSGTGTAGGSMITEYDYAKLNGNMAQSRDSLPLEIKEFYVKTMLENLRAQLVHTQFAKKEALPQGNGHSVEWRKWDTFSADLDPLTEGITPDPQALGVSSVTTSVDQFGNWVPITDRVDWEAIDDVIVGATEELSAQAGDTQDKYVRNILIAGTNGGYAHKVDATTGAKTAVTLPDAMDATCLLTSEEVNRASTILKSSNVPKIDGDYVCIIHPHIAMDLRNTEGWLQAHEYASPEEIYNGEIGKLHGVRFIETSNAKVYATGDLAVKDAEETEHKNVVPVYPCLFLGKDAYGLVEPNGQSLEMIIKGKEEEGGPLNQRSTVGYKFSTACAILQQERMYRLDVTSTFDANVPSN